MNRIGPRASKSRGSDSEYVHAYHDYNVIDRHPGTSQIHLLTYLLMQRQHHVTQKGAALIHLSLSFHFGTLRPWRENHQARQTASNTNNRIAAAVDTVVAAAAALLLLLLACSTRHWHQHHCHIPMNVVQSRSSRNRVTTEEKTKKAQGRVDFYDDIPHYELSLDEFEQYALARLKVVNVMWIILRKKHCKVSFSP